MSYKIKLFHLYPDAMNLYGDLGNVLALKKRSEWRGIEFEVVDVKIGDQVDFKDADIIFMGGGQDRGQKIVASDLQKRGAAIRDRIGDGCVALTVCGGFQLFGRFFRSVDGTEIPGIEVFSAETVGSAERLIGNVVSEVPESVVEGGSPQGKKIYEKSDKKLVGFENHSGLTKVASPTRPLGSLLIGYGNNGDGFSEGAVFKNAFGTYLHGSLLPKNPWFTDYLITLALYNRYGTDIPLEPLDDGFEKRAHEAAIDRASTAKTLSI